MGVQEKNIIIKLLFMVVISLHLINIEASAIGLPLPPSLPPYRPNESETNITSLRTLFAGLGIHYNERLESDFSQNAKTQRRVSECYDTNRHCKVWADNDECQKNPGWMLRNCPRACDQCGCPEDDGYFYFAPSDQCFKLLQDKGVTFAEAERKCADEDLTLAHPYLANELRDYMIERFGGGNGSLFDHNEVWLLAHRTGSTTPFTWGDNGDIIADSSILWFAPPHVTRHCLCLLVNVQRQNERRDKPYFANGCEAWLYPLCEKRK